LKEVDSGVEQIGNLLDDMKLLAADMGDELDDHNRRLNIIENDLDKAGYRMKETNKRINKSLKKK
jgi:methylmalonyl-CoA mutase cobalamin-binding subunit